MILRAFVCLIACLVSAGGADQGDHMIESFGKPTSEMILATADESGWLLLGINCFGISASSDQRSGIIEIMLKQVIATPGGYLPTPIEGLEVLLYDDQATSYPSLTLGMSCEEKRKRAKNYEDIAKYFVVDFDKDGFWYSHHVPLADHVPRNWYLVLSTCAGGPYTVEHDIKWTHQGVFTAGTGPFQCTPKPEDANFFSDRDQGVVKGLIIGIIVMSLVACTVTAVLIRECMKTQDIVSGKAKQSVALDEFSGNSKAHIMGRHPVPSDVDFIA